MQPFAQKLHLHGNNFNRRGINVLQVNMGKYCNWPAFTVTSNPDLIAPN